MNEIEKITHHQYQFDQAYSKFGTDWMLEFPLMEIDRINWNRGKFVNGYYSYFYKRFCNNIYKMLDLQEGMSVLVIGCGFGLDEKNIANLFPSIRLWSVDISSVMVKKAIDNISPSQFAVATAEYLPFEDCCFDRVLSREVIEHVLDPGKMMSEINRVLVHGGTAVVTTENPGSLTPQNFYEDRVNSFFLKKFNFCIRQKHYVDNAPSVDKMLEVIDNSSLKLIDIVYDGSLYKYIPSLSFLLRSKVVSVAKFVSVLENIGKVNKLFCDQVKYVVKKQQHCISAADINFVCPNDKNKLLSYDGCCSCMFCKSIYQNKCGYIDFTVCSSMPDGKNIFLTDSSAFKFFPIRILVRFFNKVLRNAYGVVYFGLALALSVFFKIYNSK